MTPLQSTIDGLPPPLRPLDEALALRAKLLAARHAQLRALRQRQAESISVPDEISAETDA